MIIRKIQLFKLGQFFKSSDAFDSIVLESEKPQIPERIQTSNSTNGIFAQEDLLQRPILLEILNYLCQIFLHIINTAKIHLNAIGTQL